MSVKIRLARGGAKKRPHYSIVVADSRFARDGRFIEKLGTFDPMKPKDSAERVHFDHDKAKAWLAKGAQPTDRVERFLEAAHPRYINQWLEPIFNQGCEHEKNFDFGWLGRIARAWIV